MFQDFTDPPPVDSTRLTALRAALDADALDGFIVPRTDEYQGEYVPASSARLQWLSGFSGSAGMLVILPDRAALFVDGRYTLQAPEQIDTDAIEVIPSARTTATEFLKANCPAGARIGIDPRLHSIREFRAFQLALPEAELVRVTPNPIDALWHDRPDAPASAIEIHPDRLSGRSSTDKRAQIADALREAKQDAMLIAQPENIAWVLNIRARDVPHTPFALSYALLHADGQCDWFIDAARCDDAVRAHLGDAVHLHPPDSMAQYLAKLRDKTIRYDAETTPQIFEDLLTATRIVQAEDLCALPKAQKTDAEIDGARAAHHRDGLALCRFLHWLDETAPNTQLTEITAAHYLEAMRRETNALRDLSFDTIAGSGRNGAIVHYRVTEKTDRALQAGDLFLVDSGGQYADGTTDVTRTILIGNAPAQNEIRACFTRVLQGHLALANVRFPHGTTGAQLDTLARAPLWAAGQDFDHGTGHGVGSYLSVHEGPQRISKGSDVPLLPGMVVSNEPGYYRAGAFGIRIENLQYVTQAEQRAGEDRAMLGFETLTLAPIDRRLIDTALLSAEQRAQLNAYHARVLSALADALPAATAEWLARQCAPL